MPLSIGLMDKLNKQLFMASEYEVHYSVGDAVLKVKGLMNYLLRKWKFHLLALLAGGLFGVLYFNLQKPKYEAVCTFILEEKQGTMGGLSSIASQFGFDISSMGGGGSIFAGDNILDILASKKVVQKVLLTRADELAGSPTLADMFIDFSKLKRKWKEYPALQQIEFSKANQLLAAKEDSVLNIVYDKIVKRHLTSSRSNKKGTIIKVVVTSENSTFSKLMASRLVEEAKKMYLDVKIGTALTNIKTMQRRSDSLLALLNNKSFTVAAAQPLDLNPGIKTAIVPVEIASRDKAVIATLYTEVTKNLEASKLLLSQSTPVIQMLDAPGASLFDNKKSLWILVTVCAIVGTCVSLALVSLRFFLGRQK